MDSGLLDLSDLEGKSDEEREPRALSRAMAAQAVRIVTGWTPRDAAVVVIDGVADQGIDAIAIVDGAAPHVYLVQAKWSKNGKASCDRSAVLELLAGLRLIDDEDFSPFNPRGRQLAEQAKNLMAKDAVPVTQVIALMRAEEVTEGFRLAVDNGEQEFNRHGGVLRHRIILASEIWTSVREDIAPKPVDLVVDLFPWFPITVPHESYQGVVQAGQVAQWVARDSNLFGLNIRNPLGRTPINNEIIETLCREPASFWYFNNGITILCESVDKDRQSMRSPQSHPLGLTLRNASVVNGAQTVRSVAEAVAADEDAALAQVGVRIIVTGKAADFAKQATQATNRQNRVEPRDFIALDPIQASILEEMRAELGLEYGVRRNEVEPQGDIGCSLVEAACALACAHPDSQYAARIATTLDVLWERGAQGIYDVLFRPQPGVYLIWNAVMVLRQVRGTLHRLRPRYSGRGAALTKHGEYLLAHLIFRCLDTDAIDEPDPNLEWAERAVKEAERLVKELLPAVVAVIDDLYTERSQISAVCSDVMRCREIVRRLLGAPERKHASIPSKYRRAPSRRKRRPNAVSVIIDKGVVAEGENLSLSLTVRSEVEALKDWLVADPRRARATWVAHRTRPILWAADGLQYSPSGLICHMWELAGWEEGRPVANQGTARWAISTGESLADLAWRALGELETGEETS